jgi:hypothetical protein
MLAKAARELGHLQDTAPLLLDAAIKLKSARQFV